MLLNAAAMWGYNQFQKAPKDNPLSRIYSMSPQSYAFNQQSEFAERMAIDAFNREASYNSPAAQMARYKEAGLNPHLIYGQGNSGNVSASTPSASHASPPGVMQAMNLITGMVGFIKDLQVKDAQINNLNMGAGQKEVGTLFTSEKLDQLKQSYPWLFEAQKKKVGLIDSQIDANIAGTLLKGATTSKTLDSILSQQKQREVMQAGIDLTKIRTKDLEFQLKNLRPLEVEKLNEVINNLIRDGYLKTGQAELQQKDIALRGEQVESAKIENIINRMTVDFMEGKSINMNIATKLLLEAAMSYIRKPNK